MFDGDPLGPLRCESLLVIPRQRAVADNASVGEDELSEGCDVEPMRSDFAVVGGMKIVVVLFLHVCVLPSFTVIVLYVLPSFVILLHRISNISIDLRGASTQKLAIRRAKVVKHVKLLLIHTRLVQNLAMFLVLHVLQQSSRARERFLTVQTQIAQADLLIGISQKSLEVGDVFGIGEVEGEFGLHVLEVELRSIGDVVVEEGLTRVDFRLAFVHGRSVVVVRVINNICLHRFYYRSC
mmetsp:Transcript_7133/g.13307  ORF Transcript_7133/g.13307 Transcript_7133/m.13307 type:complete len:238 (-) Transcript_7133:592-1305(-)